MHIATVSSKRQITIPKKILDRYNVKPGDRVVIIAGRKGPRLEPKTTSIVEETAGSLYKYTPKDKLGIPFKQAREETLKMVAAELAQEGL